jgi:hypothetical protein
MYPVPLRLQALELLQRGRSLNSVSKQLHISRSAIREWRDHGVKPAERRTGCCLCEQRLLDLSRAYSALLGYYLGDGCVSRVRQTYSLRISCDETYPGIIADVTRVITNVHVLGRVSHVKGPGVVVVQSWWNHWPCLFPQHGPGRKHERRLRLEDWQQDIVRAYPADFLRGLFHSDGCRVANWVTRIVAGERKRYDYPRWQFVNHSDDIRRFCTDALDVLEIRWRQSSWHTISVSTRAGVTRLDELIGRKG